MEQSQAQRRLVKSPPELWAELSSEDSLARHLAEFGEIRITRVEPETTVAWEGDRASGTVQISPTGWGTKVTLTATAVAEERLAEPNGAEPDAAEREAMEPEAVEHVEEPEPAEELEPEALEPAEQLEPESQPATVVEAVDPDTVLPAPATVGAILLRTPDRPPRPPAPEPDPVPRGFFARFFRRPEAPSIPPPTPPAATLPARAAIPAPPAPTPDPSPPTPGPDPMPPGPDPAPTPQPAPDPLPPAPTPPVPGPAGPPTIRSRPQPPVAAADTKPEPSPAAEEVGPEPAAPALDSERTVAILTEVLDDLGAAHHRPFSRG